jgi:diguanylate cyclase (GGDEF)-like protein
MGGRRMSRRRADHRPILLVYTALTIAFGGVALAWCAATFPIDPAISLTAAGGSEGVLLGLVFWIAIGLLGSLRVERLHGHGVLTFHFPFIIAATALGGPTAGALVALISTIERREVQDMPWFGLLSNHAHMTVAAIAGGITMDLASTAVAGMGVGQGQAVQLVAIVAGGLVLAVTAAALAAGTIILRDRLSLPEAIRLFDMGIRTTAAAEVVLGWMLWLTYTEVGWWAAAITAILVLVIWNGHDAQEIARHDAMTGLLTRPGFDARLSDALQAVQRRGQSAALLAIDLDRFKAINDTHGHAVGDDVIREVGARLRASIRLTDSAVRRGGDEFGILLVDVPDRATALLLSERIHERLCAPIRLDDRTVSVGASIGVYFIAPTERAPTIGRLHDLADRLSFQAKKAGGGVRIDDWPDDAAFS